jgi:transcriptional regulator with XRE-family HTH domain
LRARRRALGLTQAQLAAGAFDHSYISLLEAGKRRPTARALHRLTQRLRCAPDDLVGTSESDATDDTSTLPAPRLGERRPPHAAVAAGPFDDIVRVARQARRLSAAGHHATAATALTVATAHLQPHLRLAERAPAGNFGPWRPAASRHQIAIAWRELADRAHAARLTAEAIAGWRTALDLTLGPPLSWGGGTSDPEWPHAGGTGASDGISAP